MVPTTVALLMVLPTQTPPVAEPRPGQLISKMLSRYADATKLSGTIEFTQTGGGVTAIFDTTLQIERPGKLYIRQQRRGTNQVRMVVSDGKMFTYEPPDGSDARKGERFYELQNQRGVLFNVADIYTIGQVGLFAKSAPLDIMVAKSEHLRFWRNQVLNLAWASGSAPQPGQSGVIVGDWREYAGVQPSGKFSMAISGDGDLLRYTISEFLAAPGQQPIQVKSDWTVAVKVGEITNPGLFRVVRD